MINKTDFDLDGKRVDLKALWYNLRNRRDWCVISGSVAQDERERDRANESLRAAMTVMGVDRIYLASYWGYDPVDRMHSRFTASGQLLDGWLSEGVKYDANLVFGISADRAVWFAEKYHQAIVTTALGEVFTATRTLWPIDRLRLEGLSLSYGDEAAKIVENDGLIPYVRVFTGNFYCNLYVRTNPDKATTFGKATTLEDAIAEEERRQLYD